MESYAPVMGYERLWVKKDSTQPILHFIAWDDENCRWSPFADFKKKSFMYIIFFEVGSSSVGRLYIYSVMDTSANAVNYHPRKTPLHTGTYNPIICHACPQALF